MILAARGKFVAALTHYQQARDLRIQLAKAHPEVVDYRQYLSRTHTNLGNLLTEMGNRDEALKEYRQACDVGDRLMKDHPEVPSYQFALANAHTSLRLC